MMQIWFLQVSFLLTQKILNLLFAQRRNHFFSVKKKMPQIFFQLKDNPLCLRIHYHQNHLCVKAYILHRIPCKQKIYTLHSGNTDM